MTVKCSTCIFVKQRNIQCQGVIGGMAVFPISAIIFKEFTTFGQKNNNPMFKF